MRGLSKLQYGEQLRQEEAREKGIYYGFNVITQADPRLATFGDALRVLADRADEAAEGVGELNIDSPIFMQGVIIGLHVGIDRLQPVEGSRDV